MNTTKILILGIIILFFTAIGLTLINKFSCTRPRNLVYEYIDLNGNIGVANNCSRKYNNLICESTSGKVIVVSQYEAVYVYSEYCLSKMEGQDNEDNV